MLISTTTLLFLGELTPKYIGRELGDGFFTLVSVPLRGIYFLLYPLVKLAAFLTGLISSGKKGTPSLGELVRREDLRYLIEESENAGRVNKKEGTAIRKLIDMQDQRVNEAMRPRTEIVGVEMSTAIDDVIDVFIESGYSKLPVYEENLDNIKGFVLAYDLFNRPNELREIVREILNVRRLKEVWIC